VRLRSLPALLFLLLALMAGAHRPTASPHSVVEAAAAVSAETPAEQPGASAPSEAAAEPAPADRTTILLTQFTAGVRGSRAPPAASA
jgi:hypothetical protein